MTYDPLDCEFHGCALHAFIEQARLEGKMPDSERTRQRAYEIFERQKREKECD
jgi:hypothetical protein